MKRKNLSMQIIKPRKSLFESTFKVSKIPNGNKPIRKIKKIKSIKLLK